MGRIRLVFGSFQSQNPFRWFAFLAKLKMLKGTQHLVHPFRRDTPNICDGAFQMNTKVP